jgi:hypothetical protein
MAVCARAIIKIGISTLYQTLSNYEILTNSVRSTLATTIIKGKNNKNQTKLEVPWICIQRILEKDINKGW